MKNISFLPLKTICLALGFVWLTAGALHAQDGSETKEATDAVASPVAIEDGKVKLVPESTKIEFIGVHVGDDPKPRLGGFEKFEGTIEVDEESFDIKSISIEIDIDSVWTEFSKLTAHLKNKDFFIVDEFATAKFKSTEIKMDDDGTMEVTGDMTLLGNTKELSFEARTLVSDKGLILKSEFEMDRTVFGMDKMTGGVEKVVTVTVIVGEKTSPKEEQDGNGSKKKKQLSEMELAELEVVSLTLPNMT